jgi:heme-degrading monooxygenase HmoA
MIATHTVYASGSWNVTKGHEEEFVRRWTEFLQWTRSTFGELGTAQLIRDEETPGHFVSFATWKSIEALRDWRARPEFAERFGACRALCDEFRGSSYTQAVVV